MSFMLENITESDLQNSDELQPTEVVENGDLENTSNKDGDYCADIHCEDYHGCFMFPKYYECCGDYAKEQQESSDK